MDILNSLIMGKGTGKKSQREMDDYIFTHGKEFRFPAKHSVVTIIIWLLIKIFHKDMHIYYFVMPSPTNGGTLGRML